MDLGMEEWMWSMKEEEEGRLLELMMGEKDVVVIEVRGLEGKEVIWGYEGERSMGKVCREECMIFIGGERIGSVMMGMEDFCRGKEMGGKKRRYGVVIE